MNRRKEPPRAIADPQIGTFKLRLIKHGPFVAACIKHGIGGWYAEINGHQCGAHHHDAALADGVYRVWSTGVSITGAEYHALLRTPPVAPELPIDLRTLPPTF